MLDYTIQNLGDATVFHCAGRITSGSNTVLRTAITTSRATRIVLLDLAEVSSIDASGLGTLVGLRAWAKATGRQLKLMNLTPRIQALLYLTKLNQAFEVCSLAELLGLFCGAEAAPSFAVAAAAQNPEETRHRPVAS